MLLSFQFCANYSISIQYFSKSLSIPALSGFYCQFDIWYYRIGFLSHWDPYAVISLEAVAYS